MMLSSGYLGDRVPRPMKESQENQQNAETQRERYYATIHKVALQQTANTGGGPDKIPGEPLLRYGRPPGLKLYNYCYVGKSRLLLAPLESKINLTRMDDRKS